MLYSRQIAEPQIRDIALHHPDRPRPFITTLMRPLTGIEALLLQDADGFGDLVFRDTGQLQDLAGNAMTVTVVGASALSALCALIGCSKRGHRGAPLLGYA